MAKRLVHPNTLREITKSAQHHLRELTKKAKSNRWLQMMLGRALICLFIAFLIWVISGPLLLFWILFTGGRASEALLSSLRNRYPALVCHGGVGYLGPTVNICVRGEIDPVQQKEIREFLAAEKVRANITYETWIIFEPFHEDQNWHKL